MKFKIALFLLIVSVYSLFAQESTDNNQFNASWEVNATWQDNSAPGYTSVGDPPTNVNFNIYGYVRLGSSSTGRNLTFAGGHPTLSFTVYDTLVVYGNMTFGTDAMTLSVPAGGLLIVFGNLDVNNKVDISNGGNIVVMGEFKLTGAQADVTTSGSGAFYATTYNNGAQAEVPDAVEYDTGTDLQNNLPFVYDFVQNNGATPLPIDLIFFTPANENQKILLSWATASELNFDYFSLERSANGKDFTEIARIQGHGTTSERHDYSFEDRYPLMGKSYYRLTSVDFDGYTETFEVVAVNYSGVQSARLFPNPAVDGKLNMELSFTPTDVVTLVVTDLSGVEKARYQTDGQQASFFINLDPGTYLVRIATGAFSRIERVVVR